MHRRFIPVAVAVVVLAPATHATAEATRFVGSWWNMPSGVDVPWGSHGVVTYTSSLDMTQLIEHGGSVSYGSQGFMAPLDAPPAYQDISGGGNFEIGVAPSSAEQGPFSEAYQRLAVHLTTQGSVSHGAGVASWGEWPNWDGGLHTTDVTISLVGSGAAPPPELLDLLQHPDRIHLTGDFEKVSSALYTVVETLTVDPPTLNSPTAVPEPSMMVIAGVGLAAVVLRRRAKR